MPANFTSLAVLFLGIWLFALTIFFWRLSNHYNKLTRGLSEKSMKAVLESLLKDANSAKADIEILKSYCERIEKEGKLHIQKVGLLRFNPFKDVGGDQSFSLALLNGKNNGFTISSLYTREGTRIYCKAIIDGKTEKYPLTEEEKKAIQIAIKQEPKKL